MRFPGRPSKTLMLLVSALALASVPGSAPAQEAEGASTPAAMGGPGLTYQRLVKKAGKVVHVLTFDPAAESSVEVATATAKLPGFARTSAMAKREGAMAAVNGDFGLQPGRPGHAIAIDGELLQSPLLGHGASFAMSFDETDAYAGKARAEMFVLPSGPSSVGAWQVHRWNAGRPSGQQVAGFTEFGGSLERPPGKVCSARLLASAGRRWSPDGRAVDQPFEVDAVRCGVRAMPLNSGVVLTGARSGAGGDPIRGLSPGDDLYLRWTTGRLGVMDTIGGSPTLVRDGSVVAASGRDCGSGYLCAGLHPRTAVGVMADGRILVVVVDGRRPNASGMTMEQLAVQMKRLGALDAINFDGGGSSTMWIEGRGIVNRPSDGRERAVTSALLILPGADSDQPILPPAA